MKYLCLIYDDEQQWAEMPKEVQDKYMGEYTAFGESIRKSGKYVGANQLQPSNTATIVRSRNGKVSTTDGPFAEIKEHLGGFVLIEARDIDEATDIAATFPVARYGSIEVRPAYAIKDEC